MKEMSFLSKDNQGVTLVELIIVMLIISILAVGTVIGIRSLDSGKTKSTTERIGALLDYVRVLNMSKDKTYYLVIKKEEQAFTAYIQYDEGGRQNLLTEALKLKNGEIKYTSHIGEAVVGADTGSLEISFSKEGSIPVGSGGEINSIQISGGGRSRTIHLVAATGKHYIES